MPRFDGALLHARRTHLDLTLDDLARAGSLRYAALVSMERNEMRPSVSALGRLCTALSCAPATFFDATDNDPDPRPTDLGREADEWVARALATAPPLTKRQSERVSAALFGS